jgi:hypothetical protein
VAVLLVALVVWSSSGARGHGFAAGVLAASLVVGIAYWARGTGPR